jgi:hypothetical protein
LEVVVPKTTVALSVAAAALLWVAASAQQEMLPKPGPGSGITTVTGSVSVTNTPGVRAVQEGDWHVAVLNTPTVRVTEVPSPGFLRSGASYQITWVDGSKESVTISSVATNGWVEVERSRRWINLASARSIEEQR